MASVRCSDCPSSFNSRLDLCALHAGAGQLRSALEALVKATPTPLHSKRQREAVRAAHEALALTRKEA